MSDEIKRMRNRFFREGVVISALCTVELLVKLFSEAKISPLDALKLVIDSSGLTTDELKELEGMLINSYNLLEKDTKDFSSLDVMIGIIIRLVEKKEAAVEETVQKEVETPKQPEVVQAAILKVPGSDLIN